MEMALPGPGTFRNSPRSGTPLPLRPLVEEERSRGSTPNHLLESKFYGKRKSNSQIQAEPAEVHFSGFELRKKYCNNFKLINISTEMMNIHIIPTQTKYFQTTYTKKHRLVPGLAYTVKVQFCPDEWRYFYDCIRVHCKGEENLLIPVHAYPVIDDLHIPPRIDLPAVPLGRSVTHAIPLRCSCPIDFEFQVDVIEPCQAFSIHPLAGVIPANSEVDIIVTFNPVQYETTQVTFKLVVSQFNTRPFLCTVTGSSNPYVAISEVEKKLGHKDVKKLSTPASQVLSRRKNSPTKDAVKKVKEVAVSKPQVDVCTHGGVAKLLIKDPNKLSFKALKEAISSGNAARMQNRQVKEALFLKKVKENEKKEKESCRRWQVDHLGEDPLSDHRRRQILEEREQAMHEYMVKSGAIEPEREFTFGKPKLSSERVVLEAGQTPEGTPCFQFHPSINWELKQRCLGLFQQAARKVVIQCRMKRRLACLKELINNMKKVSSAHKDTEVVKSVKVSPAKVFVFHHPTFSEEDDPLALDLAPLPVESTEVTVTSCVPFFKLKVPQHYKLMGYQPVSTWEAYTSYIPTTLSRPLRSVFVEEEEPSGAKAENEPNQDKDLETKPKDISYKFTAPDFKPIPAHPLRIFNPAPGLHAHHPTPKYLESDPEFHLCPLPTYHQLNPNKTTSTQEHLMNKEVIEEIMTWKKDFNTMVSNCLSKRGAQTRKDFPRRQKQISKHIVNPNASAVSRSAAPSMSVSYNEEILPLEAPYPYLIGLPDELKHLEDKPLTEATVQLTPEMIRAVFMNGILIPSSAKMKKQMKEPGQK